MKDFIYKFINKMELKDLPYDCESVIFDYFNYLDLISFICSIKHDDKSKKNLKILKNDLKILDKIESLNELISTSRKVPCWDIYSIGLIDMTITGIINRINNINNLKIFENKVNDFVMEFINSSIDYPDKTYSRMLNESIIGSYICRLNNHFYSNTTLEFKKWNLINYIELF
tara:strand:- start:293 stop:808 length:516 start_codon:yes stop_codon:yes gene_type:complete